MWSRHTRSLRALLHSFIGFLVSRRALPLWLLLAAAVLEVAIHANSLRVQRPAEHLDAPFATGCQNVTANALAPRENAALVMLTRNSDLDSALHSIDSIERHFNQWFHYPVIFLNNEPWSQEFMSTISGAVSGGNAQFEVIPDNAWGFPPDIDRDAALASIKEQGNRGKYSQDTKAGIESYHHMCRFYSGEFYNLEVLKPYKWYWRIEPDIDLYCDLTYDPFVEMAKHEKVYGHNIAIRETAATCPSLFRHVVEYKTLHRISTGEGWKAILSPSWLPWPLRRYLTAWDHHDQNGDLWNRCHYWSNFEIADLDFFRGKEYQDFYRYLDSKGGFYFERWGDAPIHSLALALFVDPSRIHNFQDIGYRHDWLFQCPANAPGGELPELDALSGAPNVVAMKGGIGCRCECDARTARNYPVYCLNKLTSANAQTSKTWEFPF